MKEIDARGLACPAPVLQAKAALQEENPQAVKIVVDNAASQQNVQRFLESQGFQTVLEQKDGDYIIVGQCVSLTADQPREPAIDQNEKKKVMVMCATDRIGFGDDALGLKLMVSFSAHTQGNGR